MEQLLPIALAAGAVTQIAKESGWVTTTWVLRTIAICAGGIMGFLHTGDVISGMAAGGWATVVVAAAKRRLTKGADNA